MIQFSILRDPQRPAGGAEASTGPRRSLYVAAPLLAAALVLSGTGCSQGRMGLTPHFGNKRLDVLTSFTLAVSRRDFKSAVELISPGEQTRFLDKNGDLLPQYQEQFEALQVDELNHDPNVIVQDGKISGIGSELPMALQGPPITRQEAQNTVDSASADIPATPSPLTAQQKEQLHRTAEDFFQSIRSQDWHRALDYVNPEERTDFIDAKGGIKSDAKQRLSEADTTAWNSLSLLNGKLIGVILILPPPPPPAD